MAWIFTSTGTTTAPIAITAPTSNATVSASVAVTAASASASGTTVDFYLDGELQATDTSPLRLDLDTTRSTNASHTLLAKAYAEHPARLQPAPHRASRQHHHARHG